MKILLLASNKVGLQVLNYLIDCEEQIVAVGVPDEADGELLSDIKNTAADNQISNILQGDKQFFEAITDDIEKIKPDIILCVYWPYILKKKCIDIPSQGCINFHASFLPYNRGKNPNVWPIINGTPAGVTIHYINEGVDTGSIIAQKEIAVDILDDAGSLYHKLVQAFLPLFKEVWPSIKSGHVKKIVQLENEGSFNHSKDFKNLDEINLDHDIRPLELINQIRARTFPNKPGCYFVHHGRKIQVKIALSDIGVD
tara:strand:- start:3772 stop:4536 length:765 start_codon:yes stop_codon:yes gene_type:complete